MNKLLLYFTLIILQYCTLSNAIAAEVITSSINPRIVGGADSDPFEWPTMVSIKVNRFRGQHFCGGSLIAPQWVVTAAHCVFDNNDNLFNVNDIVATIGEYDLNSSPVTPATELIQIIAHPDFNNESLVNDIALLKLATAVGNDTPIMDIIDTESTTSLISLNFPVTAMGWGSTVSYDPNQPTSPSYPNILQQVELELYRDSTCSQQLGSNYKPQMLCASTPEGGQDTCTGDSGGPLLVNSNLGWQQIGIVSWGYGCALTNYPGVYTRISLYKNWIATTTKTFSATTGLQFVLYNANSSANQQITISNNSDSVATFTYELTGSEYFNINASSCNLIEANSTCQITVNYTPMEQGSHKATITINSNIPDSTTLTTQLSGTFLAVSSEGSSSSGSTGIMILLLIPIAFMRRYIAYF
ncbi:trypsin-like serine protease [Psychromonas sp. MME1]|uniref:trypsin-like serine protease n=1 Tax=Psychromonas sp. MME1 TaxID=3231032 RepID=UPI0034E198DB